MGHLSDKYGPYYMGPILYGPYYMGLFTLESDVWPGVGHKSYGVASI